MGPMSSPTPPSGAPRVDPWAEQARRHAARRAARWRRWRIAARVAVGAVMLAVAVLGGWFVAREGRSDAEPPGETPAPPAPTSSASPAASGAASQTSPATPAPPTAPPTTVDPATIVQVEEVWLLDRQDGVYDWGLVVASTGDEDRRDVAVTARLVDADGEVVDALADAIALLPAGDRAAVGGVIAGLARPPVRLEADVTIGTPDDEPDDLGTLAVRAVERRPGRDGSGEVVTGRLVSTLREDVESVRLAAIWHDESGAVIASAFHDVALVRPRVDARFEMPLAGMIVPDGPPDEILITRLAG